MTDTAKTPIVPLTDLAVQGIRQTSFRAHPIFVVAAIGISLLVIVCLPAGPAVSQSAKWAPENASCGEKDTTLDIVACLEGRTAFWDRRLNQAYQALIKMVESMPDGGAAKKQQEQLRTAQRLWLQYRAANCSFYAAGQGTIRQIDAAECMRRMTQDRAIELQEAGPQ